MSSREYDIAPTGTGPFNEPQPHRVIWDEKTGVLTVIEDNQITAEVSFETLLYRISTLLQLSDEQFEALLTLAFNEDSVFEEDDLHGRRG
jgi:hypothetical protein